MDTPEPRQRYTRFADFYRFYLNEHRHPTCRRLHVVGTSIVIALAVLAAASQTWWLLALMPGAGYGFAWIGHFVFEKNRPATFKHPVYSLLADFALWRDVVLGRIKF